MKTIISDNAVCELKPSESLGFPVYQSGRTPERNAWAIRFNGAGDMVRECREAVQTRPDLVVFDLEESDWIGRKFNDWNDVVRAVEGTWAEGVDRIEELSRELEREQLPRPTVIKRRRVWDEYAGDEVDIDRWRAADPYYRTNHRVRSTGPRVITILSEVGQNSHYASESLFWRGAVTVTLARMIEDAGYRAEIVGVGMTSGTYVDSNNPDVMISVNIKGASDALDVGMIANITSGWYFRTVYFGAMLTPRIQCNSSLGRMINVTDQAVEYLSPQSRPWVVSGVYDKPSALALARKFLSELIQGNQS